MNIHQYYSYLEIKEFLIKLKNLINFGEEFLVHQMSLINVEKKEEDEMPEFLNLKK